MTAYCPKCNEEIAEDQVIPVEQTTFCAEHARSTTVFDYVMWRDSGAGSPCGRSAAGVMLHGPGCTHTP